MTRYNEYIDSNIPWVNKVPSHWRVMRGKYVLSLLSRPAEDTDEIITCFRDGEVTLRKNRREEGFTVSLQEIGYQGIEPGDLVVHGMDGFAGAIGISDSRGKATPVLNVMDSSQNKRFLMYFLRAAAYKDVFMSLSTGIRVRSCDLRWNKLSVFRFILPPVEEQDIIAVYLDKTLTEIDSLILDAKASIEEYKAWKASIIYEAVTKGLDTSMEMKDSGVSWSRKIPLNWTVTALKNLCSMQSGKNITAEQITDDGSYPVYGGNGIRGYYSDWNTAGAFLTVGRQGALCGNVHKVFGRVWATEHAIVTKPKRSVDLNYLFYMLIAMDLNQYTSNTAAQPGLAVSAILNKRALLPPFEEQKRIGEYLEKKCSEIDSIISEKSALISEIDNYKKSLIYETVTGKRRVC